MLRKHPLLIIFTAGFILLISGIGTSYFWLTRIYLPDQINANTDALNFQKWYDSDLYIFPPDKKISNEQLDKFILVNESLHYFLQQLKTKFNESQWQVAFELIKMQPAWNAKKYQALNKFNLSPREYEFINEELTKYWILRLKEISIKKLHNSGWEILTDNVDKNDQTVNYDLFLSREDELNNVITLLLTPEMIDIFTSVDSLAVPNDSLP